MQQRIAAVLAAAAVFAAGGVQAQTVKIGAPLALSGGLADEGKKQQIAYELWLERVNAAGGINVGGKRMKVELITYDYQTNEQRAQSLAEKLIVDDKVNFMTAPFGSGHTKVVAGVAERYDVPIIAVASSEPVHDQGFKNLFGTLAPSSGLIDAMLADFREKQPNAADDRHPRPRGRVPQDRWRPPWTPRRREVRLHRLYSGTYPVGTLDHAAALTSMKAVGADWIYVTGYTKDLVLVKKQMQDLGSTRPSSP